MNRDELINLVKQVHRLDEYAVNGKYTEIVNDYNLQGDMISISWKCRHESADLCLYDLNNPDHCGEIEGRCEEALNDVEEE